MQLTLHSIPNTDTHKKLRQWYLSNEWVLEGIKDNIFSCSTYNVPVVFKRWREKVLPLGIQLNSYAVWLCSQRELWGSTEKIRLPMNWQLPHSVRGKWSLLHCMCALACVWNFQETEVSVDQRIYNCLVGISGSIGMFNFTFGKIAWFKCKCLM